MELLILAGLLWFFLKFMKEGDKPQKTEDGSGSGAGFGSAEQQMMNFLGLGSAGAAAAGDPQGQYSPAPDDDFGNILGMAGDALGALENVDFGSIFGFGGDAGSEGQFSPANFDDEFDEIFDFGIGGFGGSTAAGGFSFDNI